MLNLYLFVLSCIVLFFAIATTISLYQHIKLGRATTWQLYFVSFEWVAFYIFYTLQYESI